MDGVGRKGEGREERVARRKWSESSSKGRERVRRTGQSGDQAGRGRERERGIQGEREREAKEQRGIKKRHSKQ